VELNSKTLPQFKARFNALKMDTPRKWGSLNPDGMIVHLRGIVEVSLEERPFKDLSNIFTRNLYPFLVFYVFPWPKGGIKVPAEWTPPPQFPLEVEREALFKTVERFVERSEKEPERRATHPLFGSQSLKFWQRMHGKHFNHHLDQFGV
jgi:oxepin-CoA hydrolase / 3-oxo-5,6-dehydrosuberyl-CoA semialdehyde dehydrogenase